MRRAKPRGGRGFGLGERGRKKISESRSTDCSQRLHRKCRKAVVRVSGQWSVPGWRWCGFRLATLGGTAEAAVPT
jgi:DMSO/TMAO reductase YedYZ molybdopterin-dependent catalytic subunit